MSKCLKCGKKTEGISLFCDECLTAMERYPVKPGTVVHIPHRKPVQDAAVTTDFEESTLSQQLSSQRTLIRWLTTAIAGLSILLVITAILLIHTLEKENALPMIGRNYTTSTTVNKP